MVTRLTQLEKSATEELHDKNKIFADEIHENINDLDAIIKSVEESIHQVETYKGDDEAQLFVYLKTAKQEEAEGRKLLSQLAAPTERKVLCFKMNKNLSECMDNLNALGKFTEDDDAYSASLQGEYHIKLENDPKSCSIIGVCQQDDGTIIVADQNNKKLKRLDSRYNVRDQCQLHYCPWDLCCIGTNEIAVATGAVVQLVNTENEMTLTTSFNVGDTCFGITYHEDQFFVSLANEIRVYNTSGTLFHTVSHDAGGRTIFSCPKHIAISNNNNTIYVADSRNGLSILDKSGQHLSVFTDPELVHAWGVCEGPANQLFVCGYVSRTVLFISSDGKRSKVLLSKDDGIKEPLAICYDKINSRLIVSMDYTDFIKVFDLIYE